MLSSIGPKEQKCVEKHGRYQHLTDTSCTCDLGGYQLQSPLHVKDYVAKLKALERCYVCINEFEQKGLISHPNSKVGLI